jgi:hypothetical protein
MSRVFPEARPEQRKLLQVESEKITSIELVGSIWERNHQLGIGEVLGKVGNYQIGNPKKLRW